MPPISSLTKKIAADFPQYTFVKDTAFMWSSTTRTVQYPRLNTLEDIWSLLHEIAHGELGHATYESDVGLVAQEAQAWEHAAEVLAPQYKIAIANDYREDHLDTYRLWLHERSQCPDCGQNGLQTKNTYRCINCRCLWRANEARTCALRRVRLPSQDQIS